jgi:opacity protein-like surface antigen
MTRLSFAMALIALSSSLAFAQDEAAKVQVFGGYSFLHSDNGKVTATTLNEDSKEPNNPFGTIGNFTGWNAEAQYNFNRRFGIAVDGGGHYGSPITESRFTKLSGLPDQSAYTLLAGPVVTFAGKSRVAPYIHALFGYDRIQIKASTITGLTYPLNSTATTANDFAVALGGGVDYRVFRIFSLRLAQVDWMETTHNFNHFYGNAFPSGVFQNLATHERNVRISTGLVVKF